MILRASKKRKLTRWGVRDFQLLSLVMMSVIFLTVFSYLPMAGIIFAFRDGDGALNIMRAMFQSEWTLDNFHRLFNDRIFREVFWNTVQINVLLLIFGFPMPIIFALILNEIRSRVFKTSVQTISTYPHFLSWTVFGGIILLMTDMRVGIFNPILDALGLSSADSPIDLNMAQYFYPKIIIASIIKSAGWGSIIYAAAIAGVNQSLYEAASIDGANRFEQMIHITLPGIAPTILVLLLLNIANLLSNSFEQFYIFQHSANLSTTRVLATYMFDLGFSRRSYSTATALSLFEGLIALVLLLSANTIAKKFAGRGIF